MAGALLKSPRLLKSFVIITLSTRLNMGTVIYDEGIEIPLLGDSGDVSDGYHTFDELYEYRLLYNAALFNEWALSDAWYDQEPKSGHFYDVHKSYFHSDGLPAFGGGWFVVVAQLPTGQITNHYEAGHWELFKIPARQKAAEWDNHTPEDVAKRLYEYLKGA
jgi:hypothetical protein